MAKKKDESKCTNCGYRLALASCYAFNVPVEFDQEPYEADVVEPVIVGGKDIDTVDINMSFSCHVCPSCGWVRDLTISSQDL